MEYDGITCFLEKEAVLHPSMDVEDLMKMLYQAAFFSTHASVDSDAALSALRNEAESISREDGILYERISPVVARVDIGAWKKRGWRIEELLALFLSLGKTDGGGEEIFGRYLVEADEAVLRGVFKFSYGKWASYRDSYMEKGLHSVSHSANYRETENPHYRIVPCSLLLDWLGKNEE